MILLVEALPPRSLVKFSLSLSNSNTELLIKLEAKINLSIFLFFPSQSNNIAEDKIKDIGFAIFLSAISGAAPCCA